ncbi:MAG TPA: ATP-binding protein, partial [Methylomirabilota bacterium]
LSAETSLMGEERIIVRVMDEGSGIDPSFGGRIFEPFFTTKPSGTGLGLSICREIADFHRARLTLIPRSSRKGTTAQIEFPRLEVDSVTRSVIALPHSSRE